MGNFASQWTEELHENDVARILFDFCHLGYLWLMFVGIPVLGSPLAPTFTGEQLGGTPRHVDGGTPPGEQLGLSPSHDVGTVDLEVEIEGSQRITGVGKKGGGRAAFRDLETSSNQPPPPTPNFRGGGSNSNIFLQCSPRLGED